jgi:hypothetical protein
LEEKIEKQETDGRFLQLATEAAEFFGIAKSVGRSSGSRTSHSTNPGAGRNKNSMINDTALRRQFFISIVCPSFSWRIRLSGKSH